MDSNDDSLKIPDTFFEEMKEVRVLNLSGVDLTRLPSSLKFLSNLRTLCLYGYGYRSRLKDIAMVGELRKLQSLSLVKCGIGEFPESMKQLSDLRVLSLRHCPTFIPRNVISSLSRLEHLCLRIIFYRWEGVEGRWRNFWFSELKHLSCLRALEVEIPGPCLLPEDVSFQNLTRHDIFIGYQRECDSMLLKTVEVLDMRYLDDIKHFVNELDCDGFLQLKYLSVSWSNSVHYIMNTMETEIKRVDPPASTFPLMEELKLRELYELEAVCQGPIPKGCFANLRVLSIHNCRSLKCVIWLPTLATQVRESILEFPQLQQLELEDLPNIIEFYFTRITTGSQEPLIIPLFNQQVCIFYDS